MSYKASHKLYWSLKTGDRLLVRYDKGNINNKTYHIRGRVDGFLVLRYWQYRRQNWEYVVESFYWFDLKKQDGHIKILRGKEN